MALSAGLGIPGKLQEEAKSVIKDGVYSRIINI
jgi:hypothetical protein